MFSITCIAINDLCMFYYCESYKLSKIIQSLIKILKQNINLYCTLKIFQIKISGENFRKQFSFNTQHIYMFCTIHHINLNLKV